MMTVLPAHMAPAGEAPGGAPASEGALEDGIVAAQAGATAAALVEAACRAACLALSPTSEAAQGLRETAARAGQLRARLERLAAEARTARERAPAEELPARSAMDVAARRSALQRQASAIAALHDATADACAEVLYLLRTLPASARLRLPDATTGLLLAEAGLRTAIHLLEADLAALSDPYARHTFQGRLEQLRRRLEPVGAVPPGSGPPVAG